MPNDNRSSRNSNNQRQPPLPKPFEFVPVAEQVVESGGRRQDGRSRDIPVTGHHFYQNNRLTGSLAGRIRALSPIHIATGNIELTQDHHQLRKAHVYRGNTPVIPGASLKGVLRSIVEAISNPPSCLRATEIRNKREQQDVIPNHVLPCNNMKQLCPACQLFGALGYQGRIQIHDALLVDGYTITIKAPELHPPQSMKPLYYENGWVRGRKFYMHGQDGKTAPGETPIEVCPLNSEFILRVEFVNVTRDELGMLLIALGQGETQLHPKLGGAKPACCGSIEISIASLETQTQEAALDFDAAPRQWTPDQIGQLASNTRGVDINNLQALAAILRYPGVNACPDRNY